jgi:purine-binding chemotaxis protein CheW
MTGKNHIVAFTLDDQQYGLNLSFVERIVRAVEITPLPDAPSEILGVIDVEGRIMPVVNTRKWLGLPERDIGLQDVFVIVSANGHSAALVADEVKPVVEVPVDRIVDSQEIVGSSGSVGGVAKSDDGLIMVLTNGKAFPGEALGKLVSVLSAT